jgi:hypothetical protein
MHPHPLTTTFVNQPTNQLPKPNSLPELWSLLNFLLPSIFDSADSFDQWFNKPFASFGGGSAAAAAAAASGEEAEEAGAAQINEEEKMLIIQRLHELLRPFMLRRVKAAVMGQLPTKVEKVLKCELSSYQRRLYRDLASKALRSRVPGISMNNVMMHLRKCCNHPYLFQDRYTVDEAMVRASGKLELLDRLLPKLKAAGHRVLLFSQMTQMLDILEDYFSFRGFRHLRLDGQTSADDREERMYQFNAPDSPYFIFALSTRAGGLGLNLATADTVIFYDRCACGSLRDWGAGWFGLYCRAVLALFFFSMGRMPPNRPSDQTARNNHTSVHPTIIFIHPHLKTPPPQRLEPVDGLAGHGPRAPHRAEERRTGLPAHHHHGGGGKDHLARQ